MHVCHCVVKLTVRKFGPTIGNVAGNSGFGAFDAILGDGFCTLFSFMTVTA